MLLLARLATAQPLDGIVLDPAPCQPDHFVATTHFGRAVVPRGSQLLVSARGSACEATLPGRGLVYLMDMDGTAVRTFRNPLTGTGDFGASIATLGGDLVAGAPYNLGSGAAYLMDGETASLVQNYASPSASDDDRFGAAVAAVAGTVVVGAPGDDTSGTDSGRAFLFDAVAGTLLQTYVNPSPANKGFGSTVAVIGTDVLVGTLTYPAAGGAVHRFDRLTGVLQQTYVPPVATASGFATSLAVVGDDVAVGAPFDGEAAAGYVYLFDGTTGTLLFVFDNPRPTPNDVFGTAVAGMGTNLLVGAPGLTGDREGAAYVFDADQSSGSFGTLLQTLLKSQMVTKSKPDGFGMSVTALGDAPVVGATGVAAQSEQLAAGAIYRFDACGNGILGTAEQCDDGGLVPGDGCGWCALEVCPSAPVANCRTAPTGGATLVLQHPDSLGPADHSRDKLVFRWKGPATTVEEFGAPRTTTSYVLCLYDSGTAAQPVVRAAAPAGGSCGDRPCWQDSGAVIFKYKDRWKSPGGILAILLRPGDVDGAAFLRFRGRGNGLSLPPMPLTTTVTVQIRNNETGVCWDATFANEVRANTAALFKATSD